MHDPKPLLLRAADAPEFYTQERCYIRELSNNDADPDLSIAQARVEPGLTTRWHCLHDTTERYVILSGEGEAEIGDQPPTRVGPGDVVLIPPDCRQRIRNTGSADLVFLAICSPPFTPGVYRNLA